MTFLPLPTVRWVQKITRTLFLLLALLPSAPCHAQTELGQPLITVWTPDDYQTNSFIWSVTQDDRGVMYFGTDEGVLEFDGHTWQTLPLPNNSRAASVGRGPDGRIYVGGVGDIGYLAPDSLGQMTVVSLLDEAPPEARTFSDVWILRATSTAVYFGTNFIFEWTPDLETASAPHATGTMRTWPAANSYHGGYVANDRFYIRKWDEGLLRIAGDSLVLAPSGEQFAGERIYTMLPFDKGRTLVGTRTQGLFLYDGSTFEPFKTEADAQLLGRQLYMPGTVIPGGFLLNTLNGALIVGRDGRLVRVLDETNGLTGRAVISVFADEARPDVQWLALDQGIARVEATGPFSMFDAAHGLQGAVDDVVRHAGQLYAATSSSMLVLADGGFQAVDLPAPEIHQLLSTETALLVATDEGVFGVENNRSEPVRASVNKDFEAFALHQFRGYPAHVGVGHRYGITVLERTETGWRDLGRVPDLTADVTSLAETSDGTLWAGTLATGVVRLWQTSATLEPAVLVSEAFGLEQGLPEGGARVEVIGDVVHAVTAEGIYHFDPEANQFERTLQFEEAVAVGRASVAADEAGRLWSFGRGLALQGADAPETPNPFGRFSDLLVNTVFADEDGTTWFGTGAGLLRYDPSAQQSYEAEFSALIRLVEIGEDSLVYAGAGAVAPPTLEYRDNSFHIRYAASSYEAPEQLRYQYQLEGFDDGWSGWTPATLKEYTNVPEGDYVFRVRARNAYGKLSTEAAYSLTIRPPWHRTWWAYLGYTLGGLALLAGIGQVQTRRLQRREREKAARREAELQLKNELEIKEIEAASLRELDEMRTALFANITHEFRTPLTLILGHIDLLKRDLQPGPATEKLDVARRNAGQLQHLINQLLDVARLEAGKMPLRAQPADLIPFLRRLFFAFESMAEPRSIALEFDAVPEQVEVYFEPEKLKKVFANLVSNAVKFTPDAGRVSMRVRLASEHPDRVEIAVRDTGIGIPEAHLPHVFDRFYQAEQGPTRAYEGTGIGLALVKELTELHHGEVQVQSEAGGGTVFTIVLPLGAGHLKPDEIDQKAAATTGPTAEPTAESTTAPAPSGDVLPASVAVEEAEGRRVVLVVEDNADMRQFIAELLAPEYEVLEAPNGKAGFATARDHIPDLIVSDVMMPILDGYALAEHLRADELTSHIPIVMLTAKAAEEERLQGLEAGVDAYLAKPFSARELQVRVRKLIELRDQLRASYSESGPAVLQATRVHVSSMDQQFLDRLQETVEARMSDERFNVGELGDLLGTSRRQLYRKVDALLGCSPAALIRQLRLSRAQQLLEQQAGTVSEVAYQVGYSSPSAFTRAYRDAYGVAPSEV